MFASTLTSIKSSIIQMILLIGLNEACWYQQTLTYAIGDFMHGRLTECFRGRVWLSHLYICLDGKGPPHRFLNYYSVQLYFSETCRAPVETPRHYWQSRVAQIICNGHFKTMTVQCKANEHALLVQIVHVTWNLSTFTETRSNHVMLACKMQQSLTVQIQLLMIIGCDSIKWARKPIIMLKTGAVKARTSCTIYWLDHNYMALLYRRDLTNLSEVGHVICMQVKFPNLIEEWACKSSDFTYHPLTSLATDPLVCHTYHCNVQSINQKMRCSHIFHFSNTFLIF